ncbi:site-specific DNA-methyltransferase [Polaribacter pectinis]|uniref:site-specific DNA-methyltransferase (adenine-specific) n=1 Tax=Polaribacter pectinis TaxID=2738844 RepID=A0A7G9L8G4_9FLAO|nr:site-specific DNA-methyltransferase [Polaribacter pectinis]QNM84913.1 site-specific DNA-methyltransferase [Polaribacter pectinis]
MNKIDHNDPLSKSADIVSENIQQLQQLFPEVFKEGKIDWQELQATLGDHIDAENERFSFSWNGKSNARKEAQKPSTGTLRPAPEESVDWENTQNLYIEGDNLEVLKLLQKSYHQKVKMIYIDPPYNTGKDFVYKDNYKDNLSNYLELTGQKDEDGRKLSTNSDASGRYHSNWLNMMYPRLKLARNLLTDDGVISIHIDEHEYSNLEKLLNEIFGEENNLGTIIWDKRNPKGDAKGIAYQHEQIIFFAKNRENFLTNNEFKRPKENALAIIQKAEKLIKKEGVVNDSVRKQFKDWIKTQDFSGGEKAYSFIDDEGDVYRPVSMTWPNKKQSPEDYNIPLIHPVTKKPCPVPDKGWRNPSKTMERLLSEDLILFGKDEGTQPNRKYLLKENMNENVSSLMYFGGSDDDLLKDLDVVFDTPKVVDVAKKIIIPIAKNDDIILDFFAGSSTTAHAVMELNADDNQQRKYVMVQLPEPVEKNHDAYKKGFKFITEISKKRIVNASKKITEEHPEKAKDLDLGFKVFKLDSSNIKAWSPEAENLEQNLLDAVENIKEGRSESDLLFEILLKYGLDLTLPITEHEIAGAKVFNVGAGALLVCLADNITVAVAEGIAELKKELNPEICRVVFKDNGFKDSAEKTNVMQKLKQHNIEEVRSI